MTSSIIREFPVSGEDAAPVNRIPAGLPVTAARKGGPILLEYTLKFVDADGVEVVGGTVGDPDLGTISVQWYGIAFTSSEYNAAIPALPWPSKLSEPAPAVTVRAIGSEVEADAGSTHTLPVRGPIWPWPVITETTPPEVIGKQIVVTGPETPADGTYSIQRDDEDPVEYAAVGADWNTIAAALTAGFAADTVVTVLPNYDGLRTLTFSSAAGVDFELTLVAPGDSMTQEDVPVPGSGEAVKVQITGRVLGPLIE